MPGSRRRLPGGRSAPPASPPPEQLQVDANGSLSELGIVTVDAAAGGEGIVAF